MKRNSGLQAPWVWPVEAAHYDRTPQLKPCEVEALRVNIPLLQEGVLPWEVIEKCKVPRLLDPLEAVCDHVGLQQKYRSNLKIRMLCDMAGRERSFWGWTEEEWIESIKNGGHEKPTVASAAYLLCEFNSLHKLGRRNFLFHGVGYRVFGRERLAALFGEVRQMLHQ
jgi:hypothetical protein